MRISDWSSDVCSSDLCGRSSSAATRFKVAGFKANQATPTIAVEPAAALAMIAARRKRAARPGAARSTRVSGSALGGAVPGDAFWTGGSTGSVTALPPLRLLPGNPHDMLLFDAPAEFRRPEQALHH